MKSQRRYITNSGMLMQLKALADAMYRGHHVLDMFRCRTLIQVSNPFPPLKRFCKIVDASGKDKASHLELHRTLEILETAVDHMAEFVVLLGGCDRMSRRPYDTYLYIDNFMFGRHTEKQRLLNFLLEYNPPGVQPAVLPIIGALGVGKKTLVAHVCADERVQSQFSSILHLNEDVNEMNWEEFYKSVAQMNEGSKVVTISRLRKSEKLGTVKPMFLNNHSDEELSYLFKTLAFGSANPKDHPRLVQIAEEISMQMQFIGTLAAANATADALRGNLDVNFWLGRLKMCITLTEKNFSLYGQNPKLLPEQGRRIDITSIAFSPTAQLHVIPCTNFSSASKVTMKNLPRVRFRELLLDLSIRPKDEFNLVTWESRLPPYTSFVHFVLNCAQDMPEDAPFLGRKRQGIPS
ncbi:hypothetical protein OsI_32680 [Oryza sativa Indica Group]|nr:hypothetical protein OsI_32680 [Oryza sativa Indica Group]